MLFDTGLEKFVTHKRYLNLRQKYLEVIASLPNKELDARVNALLTEVQHGGLPNLKKEINIMKNKERSPRKEKKKQKKQKR